MVASMPKPNGGAKRPTIVSILAVVLLAQAVLLLILFFLAILVTPDSTIQIIGESAPMAEVRFEILATLIILFALSAYLGWGLWRGSSTARHIFFSSLVALILIETVAREAMTESPFIALVFAFVGWYFYTKPEVKRFFDRP